jgi:hypothetical protein
MILTAPAIQITGVSPPVPLQSSLQPLQSGLQGYIFDTPVIKSAAPVRIIAAGAINIAGEFTGRQK